MQNTKQKKIKIVSDKFRDSRRWCSKVTCCERDSSSSSVFMLILGKFMGKKLCKNKDWLFNGFLKFEI